MSNKKIQKITPLGDRVLIQITEESSVNKTKSGIIIPETMKDSHGARKGEVIAVGEGRRENGKLIPVVVKKGDKVLFSWGDDMKIDGIEYQLVSELNILAIIK